MSTKRTRDGGWIRTEDLPKGSGGRALCRRCASEVPHGRRSFCSLECVHEWRLRTDPGYLRDQVFARDRGYCALCHMDTVRVYQWLRRLKGAARTKAVREWSIMKLHRDSLWDADHIVPVAEGGGECDLTNMRTLCLKCHRKATLELRARLMAKQQSSVC